MKSMQRASDKRKIPGFLGIGAQKAGTSWLHHNLAQHPQVWMPPMKELHYFDEPTQRPHLLQIVLRSHQHRRWQRQLQGQLRLFLKARQWSHLRWLLRFYLRPRSDAWYRSLFMPQPGQISGEVTPKYALLPERQVARIHAFAPWLKVLFLLRNPIRRSWSQIGMHFRKKQEVKLQDASAEKILAFLQQNKVLKRSDYLTTLQVWAEHFPPGQMYVGFYEKLAQDPAAMWKDVCQFLGVDDADVLVPANVAARRNPGAYSEMPAHVARVLAEMHLESIQALHRTFANDYTASWLETANQYLHQD